MMEPEGTHSEPINPQQSQNYSEVSLELEEILAENGEPTDFQVSYEEFVEPTIDEEPQRILVTQTEDEFVHEDIEAETPQLSNESPEPFLEVRSNHDNLIEEEVADVSTVDSLVTTETNDVVKTSLPAEGNMEIVSVIDPHQQNVDITSVSLEVNEILPEVLLFENSIISDGATPEPKTQLKEVKPLQEVVENVLTILHPEREEVVPLENIPMVIEHDKGVAVISVEGKAILGVPVNTDQEHFDTLEEQQLASVTSLTELGKTLDKALDLVSEPVLKTDEHVKQQTEKEDSKPELVMVVSENMLHLIESMREEDDEVNVIKEGENDDRMVTFVVDGDQLQKLVIKEKELTRLRVLLGTDSSGTQHENDDMNEIVSASTPIATIVRLSETLSTSNVLSQEISVNDVQEDTEHSEKYEMGKKQAPESVLFVSDDIMTFIEHMKLKLPTSIEPSKGKNNEASGARMITFMTTGEDGKHLVMDENEISLLQQFLGEHDVFSEENPSKGDQEVQLKTELDTIISEITMQQEENTLDVTIEVSEKLLNIIEEMQSTVMENSLTTKENDVNPGRWLILLSGDRKITIDTDTLTKIQFMLNEKNTTVREKYIFIEMEHALEEIKTHITPYQAGADMFLLRVYQALHYLLNEHKLAHNNEIHYPVFDLPSQPIQQDDRLYTQL